MNFLILDPVEIKDDTAIVTDPRKVAAIQHILQDSSSKTIKVGKLAGLLGNARVRTIEPERAVLDQIKLKDNPPSKLPISLVLAMPRPKALRRILIHATAMGIEQIHIIHSYRVEKSYWQSQVLDKTTDYLLEGLEQSGDTHLPVVSYNKRFKTFVEDKLPQIVKGKRVFIANPGGSQPVPSDITPSDETVFIVGAEGGFICYELEMLINQGCTEVSLGDRILHSETAISMMVGQILAYRSS